MSEVRGADGDGRPRTVPEAARAGGGTGLPDGLLEPWDELGVPLMVDERQVKSWREVIRPGETHPTHTHRHPWITVVVSGGTGESWTGDGVLVGVGSLPTGLTRYNGEDLLPRRHFVRNTGGDEVVFVAVELRIDEPVLEQDAPDAQAE
ncbi:hypothetical protein [Allostreptomyces psammosilenae]|uniref:Cupin domain-containing protein n=1 Tax=Allostreptomyces psammosilenae TaxID=1892865 RepID=A0A852ZRA6_9ACTN|nr:hypothetical protein [Allostreptomyces psammosilenae]NYI04295.1 hypothetical protein [Allostreptomyces psammosilenae]